MSRDAQGLPYHVEFSDEFRKVLRDLLKRNHALHSRLAREVRKIIANPDIGKPLRYSLKIYRRTHVGSFVLLYEIVGQVIRFLDFDHHDRIYKK
jgi:YafQ family addiction module toxin component